MRYLMSAQEIDEHRVERDVHRRHRRSAMLCLPFVAIVILVAGCSSSSTSSTTSTTQSPSTTGGTGLSSTAAKVLQGALLAVGCYSGSIDGVVGSATTQAIRAFQSAERLPVDGVYGPTTKSKLTAVASAGTKVCSTPTTTTTTSATATTSTTSGSGVPSAATTAINTYQATNGPPAGTWIVTSSAVSSVDPTYVLFRIGPAPGHQNAVQGGYGFVHSSGDAWSVIGFGSAEVGCPPGTAQAPAVPAPVLAGFGISCPPA